MALVRCAVAALPGAHAVAVVRTRGTLIRVQVLDRDGVRVAGIDPWEFGGNVRHLPRPGVGWSNGIDQLVVANAGPLAEARYLGRRSILPNAEGGARRIKREHHLTPADVAEARRRVAELIAQEWSAIEALAAELVRSRFLDGTEAKRIIEAGRSARRT